MTPPTTLHGSYVASDVTFLLRLTKLESTDLAEKERLIQSGQRHYSQMLSIESPPSNEHQTLYQQALNTGLERLATEVQMLALALKAKRPQRPIVLVSFVRAGIPLAIILRRALLDLGVECVHYGVSIIRDKGIDTAALNWIETQHNFEDIVFVDGWVGKGAIFTQLQASLGQRYTDEIPFVVLADPTGKAWLSASGDDWLIPSGVLGATVSGLISRSVLPDDGGWHYCMLYEHLREYDQSQAFIETVDAHRKTLKTVPLLNWTPTLRAQLQAQSQAAIAHQYARPKYAV
jgi:hypothetical protein